MSSGDVLISSQAAQIIRDDAAIASLEQRAVLTRGVTVIGGIGTAISLAALLTSWIGNGSSSAQLDPSNPASAVSKLNSLKVVDPDSATPEQKSQLETFRSGVADIKSASTRSIAVSKALNIMLVVVLLFALAGAAYGYIKNKDYNRRAANLKKKRLDEETSMRLGGAAAAGVNFSPASRSFIGDFGVE